MNNNRGRPKKTQVRDAHLEVRVDADEKKAFQDAADLAGIPMSAWVRERLRRAAIRELEEAAIPIAFLQ
jgi:uncharacterized protein (DUF1778 family)